MKSREECLLKCIMIAMVAMFIINLMVELNYSYQWIPKYMQQDQSRTISSQDSIKSNYAHTTPEPFIPPRSCADIGFILNDMNATFGVQIGMPDIASTDQLLKTWKVADRDNVSQTLVIVRRPPADLNLWNSQQKVLEAYDNIIIYDLIDRRKDLIDAAVFLKLETTANQPSKFVADFVFIHAKELCAGEIKPQFIELLLDNLPPNGVLIGDYFDMQDSDLEHPILSDNPNMAPDWWISKSLPPVSVNTPCTSSIQLSDAVTNIIMNIVKQRSLQLHVTYADNRRRCWIIKK